MDKLSARIKIGGIAFWILLPIIIPVALVVGVVLHIKEKKNDPFKKYKI